MAKDYSGAPAPYFLICAGWYGCSWWLEHWLRARRGHSCSLIPTSYSTLEGRSRCYPMPTDRDRTMAELSAHAAHVLTGVTIVMINRQLQSQAKTFEQEGGPAEGRFSARLYKVRWEAGQGWGEAAHPSGRTGAFQRSCASWHAMHRILIHLLIAIASPEGVSWAQSDTPTTGFISGTVTDRKTDGTMPFATVRLVELKQYAATGENGYYASRGIPPGRYTIGADWVEYETYSSDKVRGRAGEITHGDNSLGFADLPRLPKDIRIPDR